MPTITVKSRSRSRASNRGDVVRKNLKKPRPFSDSQIEKREYESEEGEGQDEIEGMLGIDASNVETGSFARRRAGCKALLWIEPNTLRARCNPEFCH